MTTEAPDHGGFSAAQWQAIHTPGSVAISAGAGSGKTHVLSERIRFLLASGVPPRSITAVTFTAAAATELRARVLTRRTAEPAPMGDAAMLQIDTIHGLCAQIIRTHPAASGAGPELTVLDPAAWQIWRLTQVPELLKKVPSVLLASLPTSQRRAWLDQLLDEPDTARLAIARTPISEVDPALRALAAVFDKFDLTLDALKQGQGVATYADLERWAKRALQHADVREFYACRWAHVLVDELQDTSPQQWAILRAVTGPDATLTIVGDEKQSIYAFRGASSAVFSAAKQEVLIRGGVALDLHTSYRSGPAVLEPLNVAFAHLMPGPSPERPFGTVFNTLTPTRSEMPESLGVEVQVITGRSARHRATAATRVVVARLQASLGQPIYDRQFLRTRPARWQDMGLLLPSRTHLQAVERALRDSGVPYVVHGGRGLYQQPEVQDAMNLLRALGRPQDDVALYAALRSTAFQFSESELADLISARTPGEGLWATLHRQQANPYRRAARLLAQWRRRGAVLSSVQVLQLVDEHCGVSQVHAGQHDGERRLANLRRFREVLRRLAGEGICGLPALALRLSHLQTLDAEEGEAPSPQADAVQVMTVHRSKGLEFPIVAYLHRLLPFRRSPGLHVDPVLGLSRRTSPPNARYRQAEQRADEQQAAEHERLLYVACTRAADHLILTVMPSESRKEQQALKNFLHAFPSSVPVHNIEADRVPVSPPLDVQERHGRTTLLAFRPGPGWTVPATLSVTGLAAYLRCPYAFALRHLGGYLPLASPWSVQERSKGSAQRAGDSVHRALQRGWAGRDVPRRFPGLRAEEQRDVAELLTALDEPVFASLRGRELAREVPLSWTSNRITFHGRADAVDYQNQAVIDYKTGHRGDPNMHLLQLAVYAAGLGATSGLLVDLRQRRLHLFTQDDLTAGVKIATHAALGISQGAFDATPSGPACSQCEFQRLCEHAQLEGEKTAAC